MIPVPVAVVPLAAYAYSSKTPSYTINSVLYMGVANNNPPPFIDDFYGQPCLNPWDGGCRMGGPMDPTNPSSYLHLWSFHPGGVNFAMGDGSVQFISYSVENGQNNSPMLALSTRAGGEMTPDGF